MFGLSVREDFLPRHLSDVVSKDERKKEKENYSPSSHDLLSSFLLYAENACGGNGGFM